MPHGTYHHFDPDGTPVGVEVFSCAPGPAGWRYVSRRFDPEGVPVGQLDLTVEAAWRQIRVQLSYGGWSLRGGVLGPDVVWVRTPDPPDSPSEPDPAATAAGDPGPAAAQPGIRPADRPESVGSGDEVEQTERAVGFTGTSPAFLVVTARLLRLGLLDRRRVRLVAVSEPACLPLVVDQGWALVDVTEHESETGPLPVERYEVADLITAERRVVHLAGDVVLDAPGIELAELDSPPNLSVIPPSALPPPLS